MTYDEALKQGLCPTCKEKHVPEDGEFFPCCSKSCQDSFDWFMSIPH